MGKVIYVDYENVSLKGLDGIEKLTKDDVVKIFIGSQSAKLSMKDADRIFNSEAEVELIKNTYIGKNALDFIIMVHMGYDIAKETDKKFFVISKDKGYDPAIHEMRHFSGSTIYRRQEISETFNEKEGIGKKILNKIGLGRGAEAPNKTQHEVVKKKNNQGNQQKAEQPKQGQQKQGQPKQNQPKQEKQKQNQQNKNQQKPQKNNGQTSSKNLDKETVKQNNKTNSSEGKKDVTKASNSTKNRAKKKPKSNDNNNQKQPNQQKNNGSTNVEKSNAEKRVDEIKKQRHEMYKAENGAAKGQHMPNNQPQKSNRNDKSKNQSQKQNQADKAKEDAKAAEMKKMKDEALKMLAALDEED